MRTQDVPSVVASWDETIVDEFYAFIDIDEETGCWLWTGPVQKTQIGNQYGQFYFYHEGDREKLSAKMLTYELEIDDGLPIKAGHETILRSECGVSLCVNPEHASFFHRKHKKQRKTSTPQEDATDDWCERGLHNLNVPGNRTADGRQCKPCRSIAARKRRAKMSEEERQERLRRKRRLDQERRNRWAERAVERLRAM